MKLKGKVALVTGSTSGIGLGIAQALAAEGADIAMNGFGDPGAVEKLRAGLAAEFGVRVIHDPADVSQAGPVGAMVRRTHEELGGLDILVNNAGIQYVSTIEEFPAAKWDAIIAINLSSAFHAMHAAIPGMKARRWGRIINIASAHGLVGSAEKSAYVAAKHGIVGLTKVAAIELANDGITCNAICPGWVLTPLVQQQLDSRASREGRTIEDLTHDFLTDKQPMAAFSTPAQIGALAVFLCSDAASTMTGAPLSIDGGWTAH